MLGRSWWLFSSCLGQHGKVRAGGEETMGCPDARGSRKCWSGGGQKKRHALCVTMSRRKPCRTRGFGDRMTIFAVADELALGRGMQAGKDTGEQTKSNEGEWREGNRTRGRLGKYRSRNLGQRQGPLLGEIRGALAGRRGMDQHKLRTCTAKKGNTKETTEGRARCQPLRSENHSMLRGYGEGRQRSWGVPWRGVWQGCCIFRRWISGNGSN